MQVLKKKMTFMTVISFGEMKRTSLLKLKETKTIHKTLKRQFGNVIN